MSPLQSNLLEHFVGVRAVPVNTITGRTPSEALMSEIDIWRDLLEDGFFVDILEDSIALQAPGENVETLQIEAGQDLPELLFVIVALDE